MPRLSQDVVAQLHHRFQEDVWVSWVENAPETYPKEFLLGVRPMAIALRYGQNMNFHFDDGLNEQNVEAVFDTMIDWSKLRFVSLAIASHVK